MTSRVVRLHSPPNIAAVFPFSSPLLTQLHSSPTWQLKAYLTLRVPFTWSLEQPQILSANNHLKRGQLFLLLLH
ncbi:hypothetical protein AMATHDRAFT_60091 [Amanita thiersii Skay4041]|uniref:Uncharacterized protein n=1 Tax=Amanita thiersii Skay4041 TaxID=703135 RepID=A0A2A9NP05_9AGAR|nr:hypothetical protein AMATHDRAFT_60091 [Amanita thiersii Skay4041]